VVQSGSDVATRLSLAERRQWATVALGATLIAAGLYQFTPLKRVIVFAEKVLPLGPRFALAAGAALTMLGMVVALGAVPLPWVVAAH
jgi:predicted metal-binding membrane protein